MIDFFTDSSLPRATFSSWTSLCGSRAKVPMFDVHFSLSFPLSCNHQSSCAIQNPGIENWPSILSCSSCQPTIIWTLMTSPTTLVSYPKSLGQQEDKVSPSYTCPFHSHTPLLPSISYGQNEKARASDRWFGRLRSQAGCAHFRI